MKLYPRKQGVKKIFLIKKLNTLIIKIPSLLVISLLGPKS
jgi:hypothetical protein